MVRRPSAATLTAALKAVPGVDADGRRPVDPDGRRLKLHGRRPLMRPARRLQPDDEQRVPRRRGDNDDVGGQDVEKALQVAVSDRARKRFRASCCSVALTDTRGRRAARCSRARWEIWRTAAADLPTASAISSFGVSKTSEVRRRHPLRRECLEHCEHRDRHPGSRQPDVGSDVGLMSKDSGSHCRLGPRTAARSFAAGARLAGDDTDQLGPRVAH